MELKDFVTETLCQIAEGTIAARKRAEACGALVNPAPEDHAGRQPAVVQFDVAVSASSDATSTATGGLAVWGTFDASGSRESNLSHSTASRITFSIPMVLPTGQKLAAPLIPPPPADSP